MTLTEIQQLLKDSGEPGIYFELPKFSSSERLYLDTDGQYWHHMNFGKHIERTTLMPDELESDDWMPRTFNEPSKPVVKRPKMEEVTTAETPTEEYDLSTPEGLLAYAKNWKPTQEQVDSIIKSIKDFEDELAEKERLSRISDNGLNKRYTL